jgi:ABC-type transporter Mla maintaining outer membrane lipid asymmetry ATPase subunit MlaF
MPADESVPVIAISDLVKEYRSLRPLRIARLRLFRGERAVVLGFDAPAAETLVHLITGALLPDAGEVQVFGQSTAAIASGAEWLATVDRFGILSERLVLLDALSVGQNLAVPFTLEIEPVAADVMPRVMALAREVGLDHDRLAERAAAVSPLDRARVRLARALALEPQALLLEHPDAALSDEDAARFVEDVIRASAARGLAVLALASDERLAPIASNGPVIWMPATGEMRRRPGRWARWLGS